MERWADISVLTWERSTQVRFSLEKWSMVPAGNCRNAPAASWLRDARRTQAVSIVKKMG